MASVDWRMPTRVPTFLWKSPRTRAFEADGGAVGIFVGGETLSFRDLGQREKYWAASASPGYAATLSAAMRMEEFTSSARASGGRGERGQQDSGARCWSGGWLGRKFLLLFLILFFFLFCRLCVVEFIGAQDPSWGNLAGQGLESCCGRRRWSPRRDRWLSPDRLS